MMHKPNVHPTSSSRFIKILLIPIVQWLLTAQHFSCIRPTSSFSLQLQPLSTTKLTSVPHHPLRPGAFPFMSSSSEDTSDTIGDGKHERKEKKHIVIAGGGVIGTSTAYYLTQQSNGDDIGSITIIDPTGTIAPAASGKAGGFLALDWNDHSPLSSLARRSFHLHSTLAEELGGDDVIMYRRLTCASISVREGGAMAAAARSGIPHRKPSGKKLKGVEWATDTRRESESAVSDDGELLRSSCTDVVGFRPLGDEDTIAQVHPKMLCDAMWDKVVNNSKGIQVKIVKGKVVGEIHDSDGDGNLVAAKVEDGTSASTMDANVILYACGPWTQYGRCMVGVKYHSVLIPTRPRILTQSVFFDGFGDPEVYPRPDKTAYCCGFPDDAVRVTEEPGQEEVRAEKVDEIVTNVRKASGGVEGVLGEEPELAQSCYLPTTPDGMPMMGALPGQNGCFVAAGHSCWGILLGPATGEAMASLILKESSSEFVDLAPFRPQRFANMELW